MKKDIGYINGLKGIACLGVLFGHYVALYSYSNNIDPIRSNIMDTLSGRYLSPFFNSAPFWLQLFFVISGYLACLSVRNKEYKASDWIKKIIGRTLRFYIPLLGASIIIYFMYVICGGWHYHELCSISVNPWICLNYGRDVDFVDALLDPLRTIVLGVSYFNPMWWCMRNILCISLGVYFLNIVRKFFDRYFFFIARRNRNILEILMYAVVLSALLMINQESIFAGIVGGAACIVQKVVSKHHEIEKISGLVLNMIGLAMIIVLYLICFYKSDYLSAISFAALLVIIPVTPFINSLFSNVLFQKLGKISLGIYSFHLPVLYIIGGFYFTQNRNRLDNGILFISGYIICFVITIVLSIVFNMTVEGNVSALISKVEK